MTLHIKKQCYYFGLFKKCNHKVKVIKNQRYTSRPATIGVTYTDIVSMSVFNIPKDL